jgi:polyferredoxin
MIVRGGFLAYFLYLCWRLLAFRAWALGGGAYVERPEAVVGILPIGSYMSFFLWLKTGFFDPVLPAGIVIIVGALILSVTFKRGFCGWICPVGAIWNGAAWLGKKVLRGDNYRPLRWLDLVFRGLRYAVSAALLVWLGTLPPQVAYEFQQLPYYATVDAKIILLFATPIYLAVIGLALVSMMLLGNVWCRYLCPLGGLYGALGVASACTVVRDPEICIRCGTCAKVCHTAVPVNKLLSVRHPECDGCQDCVRSCPSPGALTPRLFGRVRMSWWVWPLAAVAVWLAVYAVARLTGHWDTQLPVEAFAAYFRAMVP